MGETSQNIPERLRALCLALPEASEKTTWAHPTYRVRDRIFAMEVDRDRGLAVWLKAPPGSQAVLVGADPVRFHIPPYVGPKGWIGVTLDAGIDWTELGLLVRRSYGLVAPRRLVARLG